MRLRVGAWALLFGLCGILLAQEMPPKHAEASAVVESTQPSPSDYRIGNGDVLHISVWGQDQLDRVVTVRPDGKVTLPLIQDVLVLGLTVKESQDLLRDKLLTFIKRPQVTVNVAEVHSKLVYVTGEIQRPGAYILTSPTNVLQIVARAGGVTDFAKTKRAYVLHSNGAKVPVNLKQLLQGKNTQTDFPLVPGDTVVIP